MNKQGTLSDFPDRYAGVRSSLQSYDIIVTEHKDWLWRFIGHTAMVYRSAETGQLSVYESTTLNKFTGISGVQLTPMRQWLAYYPGKVKVRRVINDTRQSFPHRIKARQIVLAEHILKYRGTPYPDLSDPKQKQFLINAAIDLPFDIGLNPDRHDIFFCTHLTVDVWQDAGYYIGDEPPSEFQPDDMREGGSFEKQLTDGISLGKEIRLK